MEGINMAKKSKIHEFTNVNFTKARKKAISFDNISCMGDSPKQELIIKLLNGEHQVVVKITRLNSIVKIESKNIEDKLFYDYEIHLDSILFGVELAETLQNNFNKKWVYYYRKYLVLNEPTYNPAITDQKLFEILVSRRE